MSQIKRYGNKRIFFFRETTLFFRYLGHLLQVSKELILKKHTITRINLLMVVYYSGANLVFPMMIISSLLGVSLVINIYNLLNPLFLQNQILLVAQNILFYDLLPFVIGLVLSIQLALNLINVRGKGLRRSTQETVLQNILPLIIGGNISALLLYIYSFNAILISIYFCFRYLLRTDLHEYLFHLTNTITTINILFSVFKTLVYCTIVCIVVGYYYYGVAALYFSLRKAISRIMTRSLLCLTVSSIYFKFFSY
jgi:ABC-type transporter Mla maintaining outer membrane lipid asymmetry permease subunit MlaE